MAMKNTDSKIRLQKYLSQCGVASRRQAEDMIQEGLIKVNGHVVDKLGTKVDPTIDRIQVGRKNIQTQSKIYYLLHKPAGYVSTRFDIHADRKVTDLVPYNPPVYPVGRLDKDTEGLLILTNDGEFTNYLTHPKHHIGKEYFVIAKSRFDDLDLEESIRKLTKGVLISGYLTKPADVTNIRVDREKISFNITINEGKKHQIYRMCHNVGLKVQKLIRVRIGHLKLGDLPKGHYRLLKAPEIKRFYSK